MLETLDLLTGEKKAHAPIPPLEPSTASPPRRHRRLLGRRRTGTSRFFRPPSWGVLVALTTLAALLAPAGTAQAQTGAQPQGAFSDDDGSVHEPALNALAREGYLVGTECAPTRICPGRALLRWELAVWLGRALTGAAEPGVIAAEPAVISRSRFEDVDPAQWWSDHVERFAELEVTKGCREQPLAYCPHAPVTRAQMATFLVRALKLPPGGPAGFSDTAGNFHAANIDALAAAGLTRGCRTSPLSYCPHASVTRAQMATFINRAADRRLFAPIIPSPTTTLIPAPTAIPATTFLPPPPTTFIPPSTGTTAPTGTAAPTTTTTIVTIVADAGMILAAEADMAERINQLRLSLGLDPLTYHNGLAAVARSWSETMLATGEFKHNPEYSKQYPPGWRLVAENIAWTAGPYGLLETHTRLAFKRLSNSPGHYANMTRPELTHIGVGVAVSGDKYYVTQNFARYP